MRFAVASLPRRAVPRSSGRVRIRHAGFSFSVSVETKKNDYRRVAKRVRDVSFAFSTLTRAVFSARLPIQTVEECRALSSTFATIPVPMRGERSSRDLRCTLDLPSQHNRQPRYTKEIRSVSFDLFSPLFGHRPRTRAQVSAGRETRRRRMGREGVSGCWSRVKHSRG